MVTTVWKFPLAIDDVIEIRMPVGAEVLHVDIQHGIPCLWARVDPSAPSQTEMRKFRFAGTGHPLTGDVGKHLGSFQMLDQLVFHLFEIPRRAS